MIGNVNGIVDSMFAAADLKNRQITANTKNEDSFSDYLNYALLNSQQGALFGTGSGISSGSIWQAFALKALVDGLKKSSQPVAGASENGKGQDNESVSVQAGGPKPDWAKIRVVRYYQPPAAYNTPASQGILV